MRAAEYALAYLTSQSTRQEMTKLTFSLPRIPFGYAATAIAAGTAAATAAAALVLFAACSSSKGPSNGCASDACALGEGGDAAGEAGNDGDVDAGIAIDVIATAALGSITDIAVDDTNVYWLEGTADGGTRVMKAPVGGGASAEIATSTLSPAYLTINATSVYWNDYDMPGSTGALWSAPLAGGAAVKLTTYIPDVATLGNLAVDDTNLYWVSYTTGTVHAVSIDGGTATDLATGPPGPTAVAVDAQYVYWLNAGQSGSGSIMRLPKKGGAPNTLATLNVDDLRGAIATDTKSIYVRAGSVEGDNLFAVPLAGGTAASLGAHADDRLALDTDFLYANTIGDGGVVAIVKVALGGGIASSLAIETEALDRLAVNRTALFFIAGANRDSIGRVGK